MGQYVDTELNLDTSKSTLFVNVEFLRIKNFDKLKKNNTNYTKTVTNYIYFIKEVYYFGNFYSLKSLCRLGSN